MKRFRFRLEKVLNLKILEEEQVKVALKAALLEVRRHEDRLDLVAARIREGLEVLAEERTKPSLDLPRLLMLEQGLDRLAGEEKRVKRLLEAAQRAADRVREELKKVRMNRMRLEVIEKKHRARHEADRRAEERKVIDESAVVRFMQRKP
jgi:flagellar export protein FliJ